MNPGKAVALRLAKVGMYGGSRISIWMGDEIKVVISFRDPPLGTTYNAFDQPSSKESKHIDRHLPANIEQDVLPLISRMIRTLQYLLDWIDGATKYMICWAVSPLE
jgi:hypothetical protein